jgi:hypothetical protein
MVHVSRHCLRHHIEGQGDNDTHGAPLAQLRWPTQIPQHTFLARDAPLPSSVWQHAGLARRRQRVPQADVFKSQLVTQAGKLCNNNEPAATGARVHDTVSTVASVSTVVVACLEVCPCHNGCTTLAASNTTCMLRGL